MKVKCILIYSIITALSFFYLLHQVSAQNDDMDRILIQLEAEINRLSDFLSEQDLEPLNEILESLKKQKTETPAAEHNETEISEAELKSAEDKLVEAGEQAKKLSESKRISRVSLEPEKIDLQSWDKAEQAWGSDFLSIRHGCQIYTKSKHFDYRTKNETRLQAGYSRSLIDESPKAWSSSSGRFPHWIIFDIGKEVTIGRFGFINHFTNHKSDKGANFTKDLEVWTSRDRIDFISIGRVTLKSGKRGSGSWSQNHRVQTFNCAPIKARFVKFIFLSNYYQYSMYKKNPILLDSLGISLAEVMAFER